MERLMLVFQQELVLSLPWRQQRLTQKLHVIVPLGRLQKDSLLLVSLILSFQIYPFHSYYQNDSSHFLIFDTCDDVPLQSKGRHLPYVLTCADLQWHPLLSHDQRDRKSTRPNSSHVAISY